MGSEIQAVTIPAPLDGEREGLSSAEAARRLAELGPNEIAREETTSALRLFIAQFKNPMMGLLAGACIVSSMLGELSNSVAIGVVVLLNGIVGFLQEYRAERALHALRALTTPRASVLRDGHRATIPAREVVPGDVLLLEAGDLVAADARLIEAHALLTNEAMLTGESMPVEKSTTPAAPDAPMAERQDAVFMGTAVASGTGKARVVATGMKTELGGIARLLATADEDETPLEKRLVNLSRTLLVVCVAIALVVGALGLVRGLPALEVLLSTVSLAVAVVPESLPTVVTIALAIGVQRMARRHVLVRRLAAVETLGCATVICTDKTGTLTTGSMTVRELWGPDERRLLDAAAACSDAELDEDDRLGQGDPTEVAILLAAAARGIHRREIEASRPRTFVRPFDASTRRMTIGRSDGRIYQKGAAEVVLAGCTSGTEGAREASARMGSRALRVLAVAVGDAGHEEQLELLGLIGLADPPRPEVIQAIADARGAGIQTVMITGDHPATAHAIARELGMLSASDPPEDVVHARATPGDKLEIVRALKRSGAVVAMTGDGVNDGPALREAHIGLAMGKGGTEVAREAADMVLTDDDFASIVAAIREGRGIFDNIRKALVYLLSGNAAELFFMLSASLLGLPLPLLPLHLLWINLISDGFPALTLVLDPVSPDAMSRPPRAVDETMISKPLWVRIAVVGLLQASVALAAFVWGLEHRGLDGARDLAFSVLVFAEVFWVFGARSTVRVFWEIGIFTNGRLLAVAVASIGLQLLLHQTSFTRELFLLDTLSLRDIVGTLVLGLIPVTLVELSKLVIRGGRALQRTTTGSS